MRSGYDLIPSQAQYQTPKHLEKRICIWQDHLGTTVPPWRREELSFPNLQKAGFSKRTIKMLVGLLCKIWHCRTLFLRFDTLLDTLPLLPSIFEATLLALNIAGLKSETHNKINQNYYWKNKPSLTLWLKCQFMAIWKSYFTNSQSSLLMLPTHAEANVASQCYLAMLCSINHKII